MQDAQLVQPLERGADRRGAVIDVVGVAHRVHASDGERFGRLQGRVKTLVLRGAFTIWFVKAAFQVGEHHVGSAQLVPHARKRDGWIGHPEQIDVTG